MIKLLNCSGGATKFIQIVVALISLMKRGIKFTDITVISASSIAILPALLGMYDELIKEGENLTVSKFFKVAPTNDKGKLRIFNAAWRFIKSYFTKEHSFGIQDIEPLLTKYITEEAFLKYKNGDYPNVWVVVTNFDEAKPELTNIKNVSYKRYIELVKQSCAIPVMTQSINRKYDGGAYLAGAGSYFLKQICYKPELVVTINTWEFPAGDTNIEWIENLGSTSRRFIDVLKFANCNYAQQLESEICHNREIPLLQLNLPEVIEKLYSTENLKEARIKTEEYVEIKLNSFNFVV